MKKEEDRKKKIRDRMILLKVGVVLVVGFGIKALLWGETLAWYIKSLFVLVGGAACWLIGIWVYTTVQKYRELKREEKEIKRD